MENRNDDRFKNIYVDEPDGGEAEPRPLKARKLLDLVAEKESKPPRKKPTGREQSLRTEQGEVIPPHHLPTPAPEFSPDTCTVLSVTPSGEGETVAVVMSLPNPAVGKAQRISFHLLVEQYAELAVRVGEISPEAADVLLDAGRLSGAIRRGIVMLGYGDHSARRLVTKLVSKGVEREIALRAVDYLTERGYIREENAATIRARQGVDKGWGERRIEEDLLVHGFTREAVEEAMAQLSEVDWEENCASAIRKKYRVLPEERGDRQKLVAAMIRFGYHTDTVKNALRKLLREE